MTLLAIALALTAPAPGDTLSAPLPPVIGSETVVPTGLLVPRPATRPCIVELFAEQEFRGEARVPIAYRPPADCAGPWTKVVFEGDFRVTAGEQYDRTGFVMLAGVNLFTGTTMEPRKALAPRWHVERDVTDYAALFARPRTGEVLLTNYVDQRYTGEVFWTGRLLFYPAAGPAPKTPDLVEALVPTPTQIDASIPYITRMMTFPRNLTRLMIDVMAQPQAADEFWWICQPAPPRRADRFEGRARLRSPFPRCRGADRRAPRRARRSLSVDLHRRGQPTDVDTRTRCRDPRPVTEPRRPHAVRRFGQ